MHSADGRPARRAQVAIGKNKDEEANRNWLNRKGGMIADQSLLGGPAMPNGDVRECEHARHVEHVRGTSKKNTIEERGEAMSSDWSWADAKLRKRRGVAGGQGAKGRSAGSWVSKVVAGDATARGGRSFARPMDCSLQLARCHFTCVAEYIHSVASTLQRYIVSSENRHQTDQQFDTVYACLPVQPYPTLIQNRSPFATGAFCRRDDRCTTCSGACSLENHLHLYSTAETLHT